MSNLLTKNAVDLATVLAVPVPESTRSYNPLAYGDMVSIIKNEAHSSLGLPMISERYGLNKSGDQMFGVLRFDAGDIGTGRALALGFRQSYGKTLAAGFVGGTGIMVCDNLCFGGDAFKVVRKNTTNVRRDFEALVATSIADSLSQYTKTNDECDAMVETACDVERGYAVLGVMQGRGLLLPNQASVAFGDWRTPRHAEFGDRNVWGLYNAVTEGLKKGPAARTIERHGAAHDFFTENLIEVLNVDGEVVTMPAPEAAEHGVDAAQIGRAMMADMLAS